MNVYQRYGYKNCGVIQTYFKYNCILALKEITGRWPQKWLQHVGEHNTIKVHL